MYSKSCDPQTETGVRFVTPSTRTKTNKRRVKATMNKHLLVYLLLCIGTLAFSLLHGHGLLRFHAASTEDAESHSFLPLVDVHPKVLSVNKTTSGLGLGRPTILWGIPTTKAEGSQRNLLRNTYLRYYRSFDLDSSPNRICSLADIKKKRVELGHCQVAYVFFMGANPDGPTELVAPNFSFPIEIDPSTQKTPEEDVVYLNIKENMEDGKSQTWFKYGAMMAETHGFDYIAKVDSDSLIFIPRFLEYVDQTMLPKPYNVRVFGGIPFHDDSCELGAHDTHACPLPLLGPYYFSGELYFMSPDLAAYIASDQVDRQNIAIYHEDVDIGNYVFSHPEKITAIPIHRTWVLRYPDINANFTITDDPFNGTLWAHTPSWGGGWYKSHKNFIITWKEWLKYHLFNKTRENIYDVFDYPQKHPNNGLIHPDDLIIEKGPYQSPVVIESQKLVFFLVGEVGDLVWIKLFRRIIDNPNWKKISKNPNFKNGLKFLNDYTVAEANKIMTSPEYTRAIFVRDPKERFVAQHEEYANNQGRRFLVAFCCESEGNCIDKHKKAKGFANLINSCNEAVWRPQAHRMEPKYFKTLDFIGHYENIREDSRRLLERIGAWDEYGKSGWGVDGSEEIFDSSVTRKETMVKKLKRFYKDPKLERKVERLYSADYSNALFNFTVMKLSE